MDRITGKTYVVTGASSGIGKVVAERLAERGAIVYGCARHMKSKNEKIIPITMDVTDNSSVKAAAEQILQNGAVYGVINCAGSGLAGALEDCSPEEVLEQFNINTVGALRVIQAFAPQMRENHGGIVINIGSIGGDFPLPYQGTYSMAKAALRKETETLRMELKPFGIQLAVIEPGDMKTGFTAARRFSAGTKGSVYEAAARRAVDQMAHDEQEGGHDPSCAADAVERLLKKKKLPACVAVGGIYKIFPLLGRILPYSAVEGILGSMYHVKG